MAAGSPLGASPVDPRGTSSPGGPTGRGGRRPGALPGRVPPGPRVLRRPWESRHDRPWARSPAVGRPRLRGRPRPTPTTFPQCSGAGRWAEAAGSGVAGWGVARWGARNGAGGGAGRRAGGAAAVEGVQRARGRLQKGVRRAADPDETSWRALPIAYSPPPPSSIPRRWCRTSRAATCSAGSPIRSRGSMRRRPVLRLAAPDQRPTNTKRSVVSSTVSWVAKVHRRLVSPPNMLCSPQSTGAAVSPRSSRTVNRSSGWRRNSATVPVSSSDAYSSAPSSSPCPRPVAGTRTSSWITGSGPRTRAAFTSAPSQFQAWSPRQMAGWRSSVEPTRAWQSAEVPPPASVKGLRRTSITVERPSSRTRAGRVSSPLARSTVPKVRKRFSASSRGPDQATGPKPVLPVRFSLSQRKTIWSTSFSDRVIGRSSPWVPRVPSRAAARTWRRATAVVRGPGAAGPRAEIGLRVPVRRSRRRSAGSSRRSRRTA